MMQMETDKVYLYEKNNCSKSLFFFHYSRLGLQVKQQLLLWHTQSAQLLFATVLMP